jgi:hypothetical protein
MRYHSYEDIKEIKKESSNELAKFIIYSTEGNFVLPTILRKANYPKIKKDKKLENILGIGGTSVLESLFMYTVLTQTNPKLILPIALTQIATNTASGIYEYVKWVKNETKKHFPVHPTKPYD